MRKSTLFVLFAFISCFLTAQTTRTVNITAGNLWSSIAKNDKASIINLTITGSMDSRDFKQLKDSFPALQSLNLGNVTVASYNGSGANTIPDDAFYNNTVLTAFVLPQGLTTVGQNAFNGCTKITAINFPSALTTIDQTSFRNFGGAFTVDAASAGFSASNGILYNKSQTELIQSPVSATGSFTLPATVTTIKTYSFYACTKVTDIISNNTSPLSIEDNAFQGCSALLTFTTKASVTTVGTSSFESSTKMTTFSANSVKAGSRSFFNSGIVTFTGSVSALDKYSFYNCTKLTNISLVSPLSEIPDAAFAGCKALTTISLPTSVTSVGSSAFSGCTGITTVSGGNIAVKDAAFNGCTKLTTVNATATEIGNNAFKDCSVLKTINVSSSVSSIGIFAFSGCVKLPSFTVGSSVTVIGEGAFRNCSAGITVDASNTKYASNNGVLFDKNFTTLIQSPVSKTGIYSIPDGTVTIKSYSFYKNSLLTQVNIPASVCTIEPAAFLDCSATKYNVSPANTCLYTSDGLVIFNADSTELIYCSPKKTGAYTLPKSVYKIDEYAFSNCTLLNSVTLNNGLNYIDANAFDGTGITAVNIPTSVTKMGYYAFANCKNLTTLTFSSPAKLDTISKYSFSNCTKLADISLPNSIITIDDYAFNGCSGFTAFNFPDNLKTIGTGTFTGCKSWTGTLNLPNGITSIGNLAFNGCTELNGTLVIPSSITQINDQTFYNCTGFTSVKIPETVTSIGRFAFYNCKSATNINVPKSVNFIDSYAFYNCSGLVSLYADGVVPVDLTSSASVFAGVNKNTCTLFVPAGSKKDYKEANQWRDFFHIIEGLGFWINNDTIYLKDVLAQDSVVIGSNTVWNTNVPSTYTSWLSSTPVQGTLDGKIRVFGTDNLGDARTGYIVVTTQDSRDTITVIQNATSKISDYDITIKALNICNHQKYNFKAVRKKYIPATLTYEWDFGDGTTRTTTKDTINHEFSDMQSTNYNVQLTVKTDPYQRNFGKVFVSNPLPLLTLDYQPNICVDDSMVIHVSGADHYLWSNGSTSDSIIIYKAGIYSVDGVKNDTLCSSKTFTVNYFPTYNYDVQIESESIKTYLPLVHVWVDGVSPSEYTWEFEKDGETVDGSDVYYLYKNTDESLRFIKLTIKTPDGCTQTYYKVVEFVKGDLPNTFTPNGDGKNDVFMKDLHIQVYDRNGLLLYDGTEGWDGTYKGNKMPQGTYYYVILIDTQSGKKTVNNYVMLMR